MSETKGSYQQIIKATSIFGGMQVFQILVSIIRSKFIAVLLGPTGMGISGLLTSTTAFISALTNFGLGTSAVKNVATANGTGNENRIAVVIKVLTRLIWITGAFGALITIVFASWLSKITFGNSNYTLAFIWIAITLLFNQLTVGQLVILQGMRKWQYLAKASLSGSTVGLIITVPLYYKFGIDGIVPAIIASSFTAMLFSWYYSGKVKIEKVKVSRIRTLAESKNMLFMGFMIALTGLSNLGTSYLLRIFISNKGGIDDVGLYNAGFAIINTYVGLVFTAIATDYYPRLCEVAHDNNKCTQVINQQAEIALLILAPIIVIFLVYIRWVVIILYSVKFVAAATMIHWAALGMLFRAASWSISFVFLAKGDARLFFWNELIANTYFLIANLLGYYLYGLSGLGISFIAGYILYLVQVFIIGRIKYKFTFHSSFIKLFVIQLIIAICCFLVVKVLFIPPYSYIIGTFLTIASTGYSFYELDKRIGLKSVIAHYRKRQGK